MDTATEVTETVYRLADARQIMQQIGWQVAASIGMRNTVDLGHGIQSRIGMGSVRTHLNVRLLANDTYHVQIVRFRRDWSMTVEHDATEIYCDQLAGHIDRAWSDVMGRRGR